MCKFSKLFNPIVNSNKDQNEESTTPSSRSVLESLGWYFSNLEKHQHQGSGSMLITILLRTQTRCKQSTQNVETLKAKQQTMKKVLISTGRPQHATEDIPINSWI